MTGVSWTDERVAVTRFPPFLGPWWLLAYAISAALWMLIIDVTPLPLILAFTAGGLLAVLALGNLISSGHAVPSEDDRE